jgi:competence protein ComGF
LILIKKISIGGTFTKSREMETALTLIAMIFMFVAIFGIQHLFIMWFSKKTNIGVRYRGTVIANPDNWDVFVHQMKASGKKIKDLNAKAYTALKSMSTDNSLSKIDKLNQLAELKKNGDITPDEYEIFKKKLLVGS